MHENPDGVTVLVSGDIGVTSSCVTKCIRGQMVYQGPGGVLGPGGGVG